MVYPQFELSEDSLTYNGTLNVSYPTLVYPFLDSNSTVIVQLEGNRSIQFSLFPVESEGYGEPHISSYDLNGTNLITDDTKIFELMSKAQVRILIDSLESSSPVKNYTSLQLGFITLNEDTGLLRYLVCSLQDQSFTCDIVRVVNLPYTMNSVRCVQVYKSEVLVILRGRIHIFPLNITQQGVNYTYDNGFDEIHKFGENWYGLKSNYLWMLYPGVGVDSLHLTEKVYFYNEYDFDLEDLTVTDNLLIIQYSRPGTGVRGVRVLSLDDKGIFQRSNYTADGLLSLTPAKPDRADTLSIHC